MTHPPAEPEPIDVIAGELHEQSRRRIHGYPAWEDLDQDNPWHARLIRFAYERAQAFVAMDSGDDEQAEAPR